MWTKKRQIAFDKLKSILSNKPVVKIFDPRKEITVTTDASEHSISGILSQQGHSIMYLSRRLIKAELFKHQERTSHAYLDDD